MPIDPSTLPQGIAVTYEFYNCLAGLVCATMLWWFWGKND